DAILEACRRLLAERFDVDHATMQIEAEGVHSTVDLECYPAGGD
nr:cation transporter [Actinomycetota bacterium]NIU64562.1 cation transporter [Actinomycetota bacterium]NIW26464.1 cation transporter [Actinomycetota bacterium]NIX18916.1 cation transporter [Actinomycetota bacterium]